MRIVSFKIIITLAFLLNLSFVFGQAEYGFIEGENYKDGVVYKTVNGTSLVMDMFYPDADKLQAKNPWVVFIHGGGWAGGSRDNIYKTAFLGGMQKLVEAGVVVATVQYRLAKSPVTSYESVIDCKDAARFLIQNAATHQLDENNYGIWGGSAGGHLSLVTALVPDDKFPGDTGLSSISPNYKGVAAYYPFTSCLHEPLRPNSIFEDGTLFDRLLGGSVDDNLELATNMSPTEFLSATSVPALVIHGENDTTLPVINATYMGEVAEQKSADVEVIKVANAEHSFGGVSADIYGSIDVSMANFFLEKFGYTTYDSSQEYQPVVEEEDPNAFIPTPEKIYNVYNPRWDRRLMANGGDEVDVTAADLDDGTTQWKFTAVAGETGYYYIDCEGGGTKPRISADDTAVSIMVANTVTDDATKWKFDFYAEETNPLFWITNKNGRRLRAWGDMVDIVATSSSGTYTRFSFAESAASLSIEDQKLKENVSVYPIPVTEILNVDFKESIEAKLTVMDVTGATVLSVNLSNLSNQIDVSILTNGLYIAKIETEQAQYIQKILKK